MWRQRICVLAMVAALSLLIVVGCGERTAVENEEEDEALEISPDTTELEVGEAQTFRATYNNGAPSVSWYVDDVHGGDPWKGMISVNGLYVAPAALPDAGYVTIRARALQDPSIQGTATVIISKNAGTPFITVNPETVTVLAGEDVWFQATPIGCGSQDVNWSLELVRGIPTSGPGEMEEDGMYRAPSASNDTFVLLARARGVDCGARSGIARIVVPAEPREFRIELEHYTSDFDIPGSAPIQAITCGSASGTRSVEGMDRSGEHIEVPMTVHGTGIYLVYAAYAARSGDVLTASVEVEGCGDDASVSNFTMANGSGTG